MAITVGGHGWRKVCCIFKLRILLGGREGEREGGREGWREGERDGGRERAVLLVRFACDFMILGSVTKFHTNLILHFT